jgi:phosphatidylserine decarboxylase
MEIWIILGVLAIVWLGALWFLRRVWFYRDPKRTPPADPNLIIAPCDGQVVYVRPVEQGAVHAEKLGQIIPVSEITKTDWDGSEPAGEGWLIGIYMSPLDVHYNYSPVAGKVRKIVHTQAKLNLPMVDLWEYINLTFLRRTMDLLGKRYQLENERQTVLMENAEVKLAMVEIADKFINKITTYIREGEWLQPGQKVSFIERGSQVDLVLFTREVDILAKVGDQVYGGLTPVAKLNPSAQVTPKEEIAAGTEGKR